MADLSLVFDVLARDQASRTFRNVGDEAERTGTRAATGLGGIVSAAKVAGAALLGAGIISGFRELYDAAAESQRIGRLTESTIRSTGGAAHISADQVGELAGAISAKTGIDDEAIQSGQNLLLTFTRVRNEVGAGNDIFNQASSILADMSTVLGTDASGSAIQLGKALNDPIKGIGSLSRAGIQFTEQQKDQIRTLVESGDTLGAQKIILAELTTQFGGAAEAAATPLDKMTVAVGNVAERVGGYLVPAVDAGASAVLAIIDGFDSGEVSADGFQGTMQGLGATVADVADGVGFLVGVGQDFLGFLDGIPGPVIAGVAAMAGFTALRGPVVDTLETIYLRSLLARDGLAAAGGGMGVLKAGAGGLVSFLGGPWGIAIGAATIGLGFLTSGLGSSDEAAEASAGAQRTFADAVREANGAVNESTRAAAAKAAQDAGLLDIADTLGLSLPRVTDAVLGNRDAYNELVGAANAYYDASLSSENAGDLGMTRNAEQVGVFIDGLNELAPTVEDVRLEQAALGEATATTDAAQGAATVTAQSLAAAQQQLADDTNAAKQAVDAIRLGLEQLGGATVNTDDLISQYQAAIASAADATKDLEGNVVTASGSLDLQSAAGRAAQDALSGIRGAGLDLIANQAQLGESTGDLTGRAVDLREQFIATAQQMGISRGAANLLADQYGLIPDQVVTTVISNTGGARQNLADISQQLSALNGRTVNVTVVASAAGNAVSSVFGFPARAGGGPVTSGGTYLVGEEGPELVRFGASGFVTPADQTAQVLASQRTLAPASVTSTATDTAGSIAGLTGLAISGRLAFDADGMVRIMDGRIDEALGDVADAYFNAGGR